MTRIELRAAIAAYLIVFGFLRTTHALTLEWMRTLGTSQEDVSYGIAADGLGNFYITGATTGSLGGPNHGQTDAFVSKYDAAGSLKWTTQVGSAFSDVSYGVSADRLGNVFIVGKTGERDPLTGSPFNGFLTNVDAGGNVRWSKLLSTPTFGYVEAHSISADGLGNVYVMGRIDCCAGGLTTRGDDIFLSKFDSGGNWQWTRQQDGNYHDEGFGVSADDLGNVYVGGTVDYVATLAKYDGTGVLQWTKQFPDGASPSSSYEACTSVSADRFGNVYVVGGDPWHFMFNFTPSKQFISKYDSTGSLLWTHKLEPIADSVFYTSHESALEVAVDRFGNAYVTGFVLVPPSQSGYYEAFVSKYDALGNHLETTMLGSGLSDNVGLGVVADGLGNVYITGQTNAILTGGSSARGDANAFIAKFRDEAVPEPAGILLAVIGGLLMPYRRRRSALPRDGRFE